MKRFWPLSILAALCLSVNAMAAGSAELVRTFVYEDTLYAYVDITTDGQPITKADAKIDGQTFPASDTLQTVRQAGSPVTYLLLLDASTSMPGYASEVDAFAQSLAEAAGENTRFILATFGEDFAVLGEDLTGEAVPGELAKVSYTQNQSRLSSGITGALDYFEGVPRSGNELRSMVILTDAVEYDPQGGTAYEDVLERAGRSDVMLHTVGFGDDADALEQLAALAGASQGGAWVAEGTASAAEAAGALAEETGSLFVTGFDVSGCTGGGTKEVSVTFAAGGELVCKAEASVEFPEESSAAQETDQETVPPAAQTRPPAASGADAPASPEEEPAGPGLGLLAAAGGGVLVALLVALLVLRKKKQPVSQSAPAAAPGIYMRMEVLKGNCPPQGLEFTLSRDLSIGRDPACDITFMEAAVSHRHARIFLAEGRVYIEDLNSQNGTLVGGTRIQMPTVLRSGDIITVGDVTFCLKF